MARNYPILRGSLPNEGEARHYTAPHVQPVESVRSKASALRASSKMRATFDDSSYTPVSAAVYNAAIEGFLGGMFALVDVASNPAADEAAIIAEAEAFGQAVDTAVADPSPSDAAAQLVFSLSMSATMLRYATGLGADAYAGVAASVANTYSAAAGSFAPVPTPGTSLWQQVGNVIEPVDSTLSLSVLGGSAQGTSSVALGTGRATASHSTAVGAGLASGVGAIALGGTGTTAHGGYSATVGGSGNTANLTNAVCVGGATNTVTGINAGAVGGLTNAVTATGAIALGGGSNAVSGANAGALGGTSNTVSGAESSAVGGSGNKVTGDYSSAVGGSDHTASALYSTAVGGIGHTISGEYAAALGGVENTVQGKRSVALGGNTNQALADYGIVHGLNAQAKRAFERTYASGSPEYQAGDGIVLSGSTPGDGQPHSINLTLQDGSGNGWDVSASGPAGYTLNVRAFASNGSFDDSGHYSCASWDMTILVAYDGTNYYLQGWYVQGTGAGQGAPTIATGDGSSWTLTPTLYSPTEAPFYLFELEFANGAGSSAVCACTAALSWTQGPF